MGSYATDQNDDDRAESIYREWQRICPHQEEAYQALIGLAVKRKKIREAEQWFKKLEKVCKDELGTTPTAETQRLLSKSCENRYKEFVNTDDYTKP